MNSKFIGSNFDEFLSEEGLLTESEVIAVKRVIAFKIAALMKENRMSKSAMAIRMRTSRSSLARLLDPENGSISLQTLERAASALGKKLHIELINS